MKKIAIASTYSCALLMALVVVFMLNASSTAPLNEAMQNLSTSNEALTSPEPDKLSAQQLKESLLADLRSPAMQTQQEKFYIENHPKLVAYMFMATKDYTTAHQILAGSNITSEQLQTLKNHGADINKAENEGATPLFFASQEGYKDIAKLLLDHDANINTADNNKATPLYVACQNGHKDIVKLLLDHNAEINKAANNGITPLQIASHLGHNDIVDLLNAAKKRKTKKK